MVVLLSAPPDEREGKSDKTVLRPLLPPLPPMPALFLLLLLGCFSDPPFLVGSGRSLSTLEGITDELLLLFLLFTI